MTTLLDGVRVVELPGSAAVSFCGKLLADVGADVIKVEPPEGEALRRRADAGDPSATARFITLNTGKASRVIEPTAAGHEELTALVADADLLIVGRVDDPARSVVSELPIVTRSTVDEWSARFSSLVVTHVTPFGTTGPRAAWASSRLIQYALSCWLHITGRPDREPLSVGGDLADTVPGLCAAAASLMALRTRDVAGVGQDVDVSQQEALMLCQPYLDVGYAYTGVDRQRNGMPFPMTIVPAADGYLGVNVLTQTQWELLCAYSGRVDLLGDPRLVDPAQRLEHTAELTSVFAEWARDKDRVAVFGEGQEWRIPFGYVPKIAEMPAMEQHVERRFFTMLPRREAGELAVPGVPFLVDGERCEIAPPPALSASRASPVSGARRPASPAEQLSNTGDTLDRGPLTGLRVVDLSMFWSGPLTAGLLAQYGADVVKVESLQRVDGWRGLAADPSIERSNLFNGVNLNKHGITLDLTSDAGRELLRPLVADADVLIENFSPRVMGNFGLTDDVLHEWNPQLTILSMPAFGLTGPWRDFVGFAPTIEQLSGLPELTGYVDGPPALTGNSIADPCAGLTGCFALLGVLHRRRHLPPDTPGAHIDLSQLEALTSLIGADIVEQQLSGRLTRRRGNGSPTESPHGCYPCRDDDTWIVITVDDDEGWANLCRVADAEDWASDQRFADLESRLRHSDELDAAIGTWTRRHEHVDLAERLQAAGVAAAPVLWPSELYGDPHLAARGSYVEIDREHVGRCRYPALPFKFSATPGVVETAGPTLGQHNDAILGQRLGLPPATLNALRARSIIGEALPDD